MSKAVLSSLLLFIFFTLSCATTDQAAEPDSETEIIEATAPGWFNSSVDSALEAGVFTGYSHATASNRADAERLAKETAIVNLKFEIDRYVEKVRNDLAENRNANLYGSSRFIINLRNAVQDLNLDSRNVETEFFEEGVINSYSMVQIAIDEVVEMLSEKISDSVFLNELQPSLQ